MTELFKYQREGVDFLLKHKQVILADEMGLGKSLQAATAAEWVDEPWLIVCPAYLKDNWAKELEFHGILTDKLRGIISYSSLGKNEFMFKGVTTVIFDEAHYLKNMKTAQRTKHAHKYCEIYKPENIYLLSGTPIKNRVSEFYSLLRLLGYNCSSNGRNVFRDFPNEYRFNSTFTNKHVKRINLKSGRSISKVEWKGLKNKEGLKSYLKGKYKRRLADKVLELPDLIENNIFAGEMSEKLSEELSGAWDAKTSVSTAKLKAAKIKAEFTADYARDLYKQDEPFVIFTYHPDVAELLEGYLLSGNINTKIITGNTPTEERGVIVSEFQNGKLDGLILTIGAGSTGFTLTRARHLIFNDLSWVPGDNNQAKKRIHRISQNKKCFIHYIVAGKIDEMIINTLREKEKTIKEII
jgi:SWI/SNF-related matrix-associated actin-dependent regulator 1 of chromatin subfamily A